ncbi:hypothetical protein DFH11DRAFT_1691196 [Phellopilus nigrolimitatus]|nr:hypothetical protein DFH11DRAFT_1691196 [Phellopilus nigrolimitatus]
MAPLSEALQVIEVENDGTGGGKESTWGGNIDGYSLGLIIESCIAHQKKHSPGLLDPIHVSAYYLRPTQALVIAEDKGSETRQHAALFEVRLKTVKLGKQMCNIEAEMVQSGQTTISARFIFGLLSPIKTAASEFIEPKALNPPSPTPLHAVWNFKKYISGKEDKVLTNMNRPENRKFLSHSTAGVGAETTRLNGQREPPGLEFGATPASDIVKPLPGLLPSEENPLQGKTSVPLSTPNAGLWYAALTLSIEFKTPLRLYDFDPQQSFSHDTVGLYSLGRFMQDPLGRRETYVEVKGEDWREKQQCLAIATQTAICVPYETQIVTMKVRV